MRRGLWVLLVVGCATSGTTAFKRAGESADVGAALARMRPATGVANETGRPLAFIVSGGTAGKRVLAFDVEARAVLWDVEDEVTARIAVGGPMIVYARGDNALVARDVKKGTVLWWRALAGGARRIGYTADADAAYEVVTSGEKQGATLIALDGHTGRVRWQRRMEGDAAAPAARGGVVAVPRASQHVSLFDAANGKVLAHILARDEAVTFVRALPEGLFFGSRSVFLASAETATATREAAGHAQVVLPSFVRPAPFHHDMYRPEQGDYSALDRNKVLWRVAVDGPRAAFADGLVVVHSLRFFFGLEASTGKLRWAFAHPNDAVASERTARLVHFVTAEGELGAVDARTGAPSYQAKLPPPRQGTRSIRGATLDVEGYEPPASGDAPVARALASVVFDPDTRFTDVKLFAIEQLAALPGPDVTAELLRAVDASALSEAVIQRAADLLVKRRDPASANLFVEALRAHADFVEDRRAPNLPLIAAAVAGMGPAGKGAVPALVAHLARPETDPGVVRDIAAAALAAGARDAIPAFKDYLVQYRADPVFQDAPTALIASADVLVRLGGPADRALLVFVQSDPRTVEALRLYLRSVVGEDAPVEE